MGARSKRGALYTEAGGVYVFTRIDEVRDGLGVLLNPPQWSRAQAVAGEAQPLQVSLEQMMLQDNSGKENRRRLGSDVAIDGYTLISGAPGETPIGVSDPGRTGKISWMESRVTGGATIIDTKAQHVTFSQRQ